MSEQKLEEFIEDVLLELLEGTRTIITWRDVGNLIYEGNLVTEQGYVSYPFGRENIMTEEYGNKEILEPNTSPESVRAIACWWEHGGSEGWKVHARPIYQSSLTDKFNIRSDLGLSVKIMGRIEDAEKCVYFVQTILNRWLVL